MKNFIEWAEEKNLLEEPMPAHVHDDDDEEECDSCGGSQCSQCGGELQMLGKLGCMDHYRCRQCGIMTNKDNGSCG